MQCQAQHKPTALQFPTPPATKLTRTRPRLPPRQIFPRAKKKRHSVAGTVSFPSSRADPDRIPATDLYADVPFYGQFLPRPDNFRVDVHHINS